MRTPDGRSAAFSIVRSSWLYNVIRSLKAASAAWLGTVILTRGATAESQTSKIIKRIVAQSGLIVVSRIVKDGITGDGR